LHIDAFGINVAPGRGALRSPVPTSKTKVLVAMSGGVDSSVAAALLQREGYEVVGCFMRLGSPGETLDRLEPADASAGEDEEACGSRRVRIGHQGCCSINDAADARLVAERLGVPFYVCNFKDDFGRIIDYFVGEYNEGRTPNPCVRCNDWLKFGKLHTYARQIDATYVASGHHARVEHEPSPGANRDASSTDYPRLRRGVDRGKDQSYVLFGATPARLREMLLPIGHYTKGEVRRLARDMDLPVFDKPDSQEICFVPDNDYAGLVRRRSPERVAPGAVVDTSGRRLGEHPGHQHFTVGQRRGVGVALGYPIYVVDKDPRTNTVTVGPREELLSAECHARGANWLVPAATEWRACAARIRYNAEPVPARVRSSGPDMLAVQFEEPQFAVAPGQAVVCYDGDVVICGGWIDG
jgi:tRNA-specific 2-thiouridylase